MTMRAAILCLAAVAATPAVADDHAPSSLRMREPRPARTRWTPLRLGPRVAQRAPGDPPAPSGDPPATAPSGDPPASPPPGEPPATPPAGEPPAAGPPAKLTDEERAALAQQEGKTEVISVTDSTVEHELFTGRAPVTVVTRADLVASGRASLGDILQSLPMQSNAGNSQVNAGGDGTTRISLRGLGAPRTLVLLNGRRIVNGGNGADAAVDINAIPLPAIERVEILKDGASALYGADAVGGVVNLITRPQFDGTDVSLLTSTSQKGDGTEYDGSFVTGFTTRDKRTYLVVSGGVQRHEAVFAGDRAFSAFQNSYDFANKTRDRATPRSRRPAAGSTRRRSAREGCARRAAPRTRASPTAPAAGPTSSRRATATTRRRPATCTRRRRATTRSRPPATGSTTAPRCCWRSCTSTATAIASCRRSRSPRTARSARTACTTRCTATSLDYRRRITELGPRQYLDDVSMIRAVTGITGSTPASWGRFEDWNYEVSFNYGETHSLVGTTGQLLKPRRRRRARAEHARRQRRPDLRPHAGRRRRPRSSTTSRS